MSVLASVGPVKPVKPYPDFPLTPHAKGWYVKHKGRSRFVCGATVEPTQAIIEWDKKKRQWDAEDGAASAPPAQATNDIALAELADHFLTSKEARAAETGGYANFDEFCEAIRDFCATVGANRLVAYLTPLDFQRHRSRLKSRCGIHRQKKFMVMVRGMFKWGVENGILARLPLYGSEYRPPAAREMRLDQARREREGETRMFSVEELAALFKTCIAGKDYKMLAMILLGLNGGYGQSDAAYLPVTVVDLLNRTITYRRGKTGIQRRVVLWPETAKLLLIALEGRPLQSAPQWRDLIFLTRWGNPYLAQERKKRRKGGEKTVKKDQVGMRFLKLCRKAGVYEPGRSFYSLRRTFRTIADESLDDRAINLIMGHVSRDMGATYVKAISDDRLDKVVSVVRQRLWKAIEVVWDHLAERERSM